MLITQRQERRLWAIALVAIVALLWFAPHEVAASKKEKSQPSLEIKISGPSFFREGQKLKFKAVLINRSTASIVLAPPSSRLGFGLSWKIMDPEGRELKPLALMICPVTGIEPGAKFRLQDDDVRILLPGEKVEYEDQDIGFFNSFRESGRYEIVAHYYFASPELSADGNTTEANAILNQPTAFDLSFLSPQKADALRHAVAVGASSNRWSIQVID